MLPPWVCCWCLRCLLRFGACKMYTFVHLYSNLVKRFGAYGIPLLSPWAVGRGGHMPMVLIYISQLSAMMSIIELNAVNLPCAVYVVLASLLTQARVGIARAVDQSFCDCCSFHYSFCQCTTLPTELASNQMFLGKTQPTFLKNWGGLW